MKRFDQITGKGDVNMTIDFEFIVGQRVISPFDESGLVQMAAVDDGGIQYYVVTKSCSSWFRADQLSSST